LLIRDLDNRSIEWKVVDNTRTHARSSLHLEARAILYSKYPTQQIFEEVSIPIRKRKTLFLDFYLPMLKLAVEPHGEQHYKKVSFYHATAADFLKQKQNDREKAEWCGLNGITYIPLKFDEIDSWKEKI